MRHHGRGDARAAPGPLPSAVRFVSFMPVNVTSLFIRRAFHRPFRSPEKKTRLSGMFVQVLRSISFSAYIASIRRSLNFLKMATTR